jgi:hypothetical protein
VCSHGRSERRRREPARGHVHPPTPFLLPSLAPAGAKEEHPPGTHFHLAGWPQCSLKHRTDDTTRRCLRRRPPGVPNCRDPCRRTFAASRKGRCNAAFHPRSDFLCGAGRTPTALLPGSLTHSLPSSCTPSRHLTRPVPCQSSMASRLPHAGDLPPSLPSSPLRRSFAREAGVRWLPDARRTPTGSPLHLVKPAAQRHPQLERGGGPRLSHPRTLPPLQGSPNPQPNHGFHSLAVRASRSFHPPPTIKPHSAAPAEPKPPHPLLQVTPHLPVPRPLPSPPSQPSRSSR